MKRAVVFILILFAGCGEQLAYAGCHQRVRRVVAVQKYAYAPVAALVQPIYYSVGEDLRRQALVEAVTTRVLEQENARLRQQIQQQQQAQQQQYQPHYAPQRQTAPQSQPQTGGWRWKGEGEVYQDGSLPAGPGAGAPPTPAPGGLPPEPQPSNLSPQVSAIFQRSCVKCHNAQKREGGIDLSGDPNQLDDLTAYKAVFQVDIGKMPKKPAQILPDDEVQLLKEWLSGG